MYQQYFQLETLPFENLPDPRFFFASEEHREALAAIEYTIRMRKGFVMVTGEVGAGKTTVGRTMIERCADQVRVVPVLHNHQTGMQLLRQTLRALEISYQPTDDHAELLEKLFIQLYEQQGAGLPTVLLVDEAQTLSDEALEELRLLSNFDTSTDKMVQVVLIGQPELATRLRGPKLRALRQRIAMVKHVRPLNITETAAYIRHRLRTASIDPQNVQVQFAGSTIDAIHQATGGVPRLINFCCDNCLLLAMVSQTRQITPAMVLRVVEDMSPSLEEAPASRSQSSPRLAIA